MSPTSVLSRVGRATGAAATPFALLILVALALTGCRQPSAITDPATGATYYTQAYKVDRDGAVTFDDATTGKERTILNPRIRSVSPEEFRREVGYVDDVSASKPLDARRTTIDRRPAPPAGAEP